MEGAIDLNAKVHREGGQPGRAEVWPGCYAACQQRRGWLGQEGTLQTEKVTCMLYSREVEKSSASLGVISGLKDS
eukprot:1160086-Pelagomonas_calceolata.AAC.6